MKFRPVCLLLPLLVVVQGCGGSPNDRMVGIWTLEPQSLVLPDIPALEGNRDRFERFARNMRLKLHSDHQFVLITAQPVEGKWSLDGENLHLTPNANEKPGLVKELEITVDPGQQGITLHRDLPFGKFSMRLHKSG